MVTSIEVWEELKIGGDALFDWLDKRKLKTCIDYDEATQKAMRDILSKYPKLISDKTAGTFGADPHVIAVAQVNGFVVVANENKKTFQAKKLGIPDVCEVLNVRCIKFLEFLQEQKWEF